jgi:hypothetical protein
MTNAARSQWEQLAFVMEEVFVGHQRGATFLDDGDAALLDMLKRLTASEATSPICGESIAAHARHVLFSIGAYLNAVEQNEPSFIAENWPKWDSSKVNPDEWRAIIADMESQIKALLFSITMGKGTPGGAYLLALGALAHMSFHLGAIQVKYDVLKNSA